jgi:hypothetical protein
VKLRPVSRLPRGTRYFLYYCYLGLLWDVVTPFFSRPVEHLSPYHGLLVLLRLGNITLLHTRSHWAYAFASLYVSILLGMSAYRMSQIPWVDLELMAMAPVVAMRSVRMALPAAFAWALFRYRSRRARWVGLDTSEHDAQAATGTPPEA